MILYSAKLSLFARKVEIALHEKGLGFTRVQVPFSQEKGYAPKHPEVLRVNPKGQVPVLVDRELALFDSTLIMEYLEDLHPLPPLLPREAAERALCRQSELLADEVFLVPLRGLMHRTEPSGPDDARRAGLEAKVPALMPELARHFASLDAMLEGRKYLHGRVSIADIAMFLIVLWSERLAGPDLSTNRNLARWFRMLAERPAFARTLEEILEADAELSAAVPGAFPSGLVDRPSN